MNEESFWVMVSTTPTWVSLGASEKVIQVSCSMISHLHDNTLFVKALGQVLIGAKPMIKSITTQRPTKDVKEALLGGNLVSLTLLFNFMFHTCLFS